MPLPLRGCAVRSRVLYTRQSSRARMRPFRWGVGSGSAHDNLWSQTFPIKNALCLAIGLIVQTICPGNVKHIGTMMVLITSNAGMT